MELYREALIAFTALMAVAFIGTVIGLWLDRPWRPPSSWIAGTDHTCPACGEPIVAHLSRIEWSQTGRLIHARKTCRRTAYAETP